MKKLLLLALITVSCCYASEEPSSAEASIIFTGQNFSAPILVRTISNSDNNETSITYEKAHFYGGTARVLALHEKIKRREQLTDEDNELLKMIGRLVMRRVVVSR